MRHNHTTVRMTIIKKTRDKCWKGHREKETLVRCWQKCKLVDPLQKNSTEVPQEIKIELPYDSAILLLGIYLKVMNT